MKRRFLTLIFTITAMLMCIFGLSACGEKDIKFKLNFVVDNEIYATIDTSGDEVIALPENPKKENHSFDGWYWDKDTWQTPFTANSLLDTPLSSDMSVYAKFSLNTIQGVTFEDVETTYDGTEKIIAVSKLPDGASVVYDKANTYINAGEYTVTATVSQENHEDLQLTATLTIKKAVYDMNAVVFADKTVTYNGEAHSITATNLPDGVSATYQSNGQINADEYTITACFTGDSANYESIENKTAILKIEKASVSKPAQDSTSFVYNGNEQTYQLAENILYTISGNKQTNAGNYTVTVSLKDKNNYQWNDQRVEDLSYPFNIAKATYDMSGVVFADKTVTYNGESHSITATNLPNGVTAQYTGNNQINADQYTITATFTGDSQNYEPIASKTATLTINKATYDISGVRFEHTEATYDGQAHFVTVTGLPSGVSVSWENNGKINADEYTVTAKFTGDSVNHELIADKTTKLTIHKATITGITFTGTEYTYDGTAKSLAITGMLPDGVTVSYMGNDKTNAGEYSVTATFTKNANYNDLSDMQATLKINKATYDMSGVVFADKTVAYNGESHSITATNLPNNVTAQYTGNNQINADQYTITATFTGDSQNYEPIASKTATLTIEQRELTLAFSGETTLKYNGNVQKTVSVQATNLLSGDIVELTINYNGEMIEEGEYIATAILTTHQNYKLTANNTVKVAITRDAHTVTFKQDGFSDVTREVLDLADLTDIPTPQSVNGYIVVWEEKDFICVTDDIVVNANYILEVYTITYILDGGENHLKNPSTYSITDSITLKECSKDYYTFNGWYSEPEFANKVETLYGQYGDLILYAKFVPYTYNSVFNANGGVIKHKIVFDYGYDSKENEIVEIEEGTTFDIYTQSIPSRENYIFMGWYFDKAYTNIVSNGYLIVEDVYLYAKWDSFEDNNYVELGSYLSVDGYGASNRNGGNRSETKYFYVPYYCTGRMTLTYNFSGGTVGGSGSSYKAYGTGSLTDITTGEKIYYGKYYGSRSSSIDIMLIPGHLYKLYAYGTYTAYTKNDNHIYITGSCHLTIKNIEKLSTNIKCENTVSQCYDGNTVMPVQAVRQGYDFMGWYDENDELIHDSWDYTCDKEFYAKWAIHNYSINYELNGGINSLDNPTSYTLNDTITLSNPSRDGYTFVGWFKNAFSAEIRTINGIDCLDYTLYARWTPIKYTATLDYDGGQNCPTINFYSYGNIIKSVDLYKDSTLSYFIPIAPAENLVFGGWYTDSNFTTIYAFSGTVNKDIDVYAKWIDVSNINYCELGEERIADINGNTNQYIAIASPISQTVIISSDSSFDLYGEIYDSNWNLIISNDDISDDDLDFSMSIQLNAGEIYYIGYKANQASISGNCEIIVCGDKTSSSYIIGDYTEEIGSILVSYENTFILPTPKKEGFEFLGWFDAKGKQIDTSKWNYTEDITIFAYWEEK